jgi:hypothetical protein
MRAPLRGAEQQQLKAVLPAAAARAEGATREGEAAIGRRRCEAVVLWLHGPLVNKVQCNAAAAAAADPEVWA